MWWSGSGVGVKALLTWPPRLFEVKAAFRMSRPVMLLGGGGVGGEIGGGRVDVPLVLAKPRSQNICSEAQC